MSENFPSLMKTVYPQVQEAQQIPSTKKMKKITPMHIIINFSSSLKKEKVSRATDEYVQKNEDKDGNRRLIKNNT